MKNQRIARDVGSIDAIIAAAYDVISGPAGKKRDWDRERSLFYPGARLIPTAKPGGNDALMPQILDVDGFIARAEPLFAEHGFYEKEIARRTEQFGCIAHVWSTNRVITRTIQNHSCAELTAFSCSTTEGVGGFCQSIGNTKQRRIRSQENFFNAEPSVGADDCGSVAPAMDVHRGSIL